MWRCLIAGCGDANQIAAGPTREAQVLAGRATLLLEKGRLTGSALAAASSARRFRRTARCYASLKLCDMATSAAKAAKSSFRTASDANTAATRQGGEQSRICAESCVMLLHEYCTIDHICQRLCCPVYHEAHRIYQTLISKAN